METITTLVGSLTPLKWAAIAFLALLAWRNKDLLAPVTAWLKGFRPSITTTPADAKPTAEDAFHAVNVLLAHFAELKCDAGLAATREAGRHLFDSPGEHAT